MTQGFLLPVYNHGFTLESVIKNLLPYNLPIIVVDDGNDAKNKTKINEVAEKYSSIILVSLKKNKGKGAAIRAGILQAQKSGLTHILQVDSDGQHDTGQVEHFLQKSMQNPDAVICGYPEYDESAPSHRIKARKFANGWVHIVTLSKEIKDCMVGFRVYPIAAYIQLIKKHAIIDSRMGADIDLLVRLSWAGVRIISEPVKITYPVDGISNFRVVRDNLRISGTYARLCIGMIVRLPYLIIRNIKKTKLNKLENKE
ncbi:MAG: glycosyltransferase family 2 protein [Treponema sp.]|nr:glycosyltransferase family 2 protein [Treponema sp.]